MRPGAAASFPAGATAASPAYAAAMRIVSTLAAALAVLASAPAQKPAKPRTLDSVLAAFAAQVDALYADGKSPTREQESELRSRQLQELESFAQHEAEGDDRWSALAMLAGMCAESRQKPRAQKALAALDVDTVPFAAAIRGAEVAAAIDDAASKASLIARAEAKATTIEQRMDLARALMTSLREVSKGEAIADREIAAAKDDEAKAYARWLRCNATREREDLPENSYYDALEELAASLPATRWGGIAKDRCAASKFQLGISCFPFRATTLAGAEFASDALRGKAIALVFCDTTDPSSNATLRALADRRTKAKDDLAVLIVAIDADCATATRSAKDFGDALQFACDGRGMDAELALRFHVETAPTVVLLDRKGAIAGLNLHSETRESQQELDEALARALAK